MSERLGGLRLHQPIVHRAAEVVGNLRNLTRRDECADGHKTPVARREVRTEPQVAEQQVRRVLRDSRGHLAELLSNTRGTPRLGGLVQGKRLW